jgi:hypothetical protein
MEFKKNCNSFIVHMNNDGVGIFSLIQPNIEKIQILIYIYIYIMKFKKKDIKNKNNKNLKRRVPSLFHIQ